MKRFTETNTEQAEFRVPFFPGFYNSVFSEEDVSAERRLFENYTKVPEEILDYIADNSIYSDNWDDYKIEVGEAWINNLTTSLQQVIPNFKATYKDIESPRYYNYETDSLWADCNLSEISDDIKNYVEKNKEAFKKWVKDNHSSYDGFISFYSDNADEWDLDNLDENELGSVLGFILYNENPDIKETLTEFTYNDVPGMLYFLSKENLRDIQNHFDINITLESGEDLEHLRKEGDKYIYVPDNKNQLKLGLKYENRRIKESDFDREQKKKEELIRKELKKAKTLKDIRIIVNELLDNDFDWFDGETTNMIDTESWSFDDYTMNDEFYNEPVTYNIKWTFEQPKNKIINDFHALKDNEAVEYLDDLKVKDIKVEKL